jgi:hypothetical protein
MPKLDDGKTYSKPLHLDIPNSTVESAILALNELALHYPGAVISDGDVEVLVEFEIDRGENGEPIINCVFEDPDEEGDDEDDTDDEDEDEPASPF